MSKQIALYRLYDANDMLLYIGIAENLEIRWGQHSRVKPWWPDVARKDVVWLPGRKDAVAAEGGAIAAEGPAYNIQLRATGDRHVMPATKWWEYVQDISGQASQTEIARRLGMSQPGINRWQFVIPKTESVIAFARAYNRPILEAFLAAEYISDEDARMTEVQADVSGMDTDALVQLLHRAADELSRRPPA